MQNTKSYDVLIPQATAGDTEEVKTARAEIMHLAEPQDPVVNTAITCFGPVTVAGLLAGRIPITGLAKDSRVEELIGKSGAGKLYDELAQRARRWSARTSRYDLAVEIRHSKRVNAWLCTPEDDDWPVALNDLGTDAPYGIWGRGDRSLLDQLTLENSIAVVGSRDTSPYGNSATTHIAGDLAAAGKIIVSGGALGIDAVAHRSALATSTAILPTVALMACGVDRPYPQHNKQLLNEIIERGLLLSEVPLGYSPTRWRFLQRNRLIASLTRLTLVVEARWRSGALNTAHHALEIGRELRAVPGQIFSPNSEGCHRLIRDGLATMTTGAAEILQDFNQYLAPEQEELSVLSAEERKAGKTQNLTEVQSRVWDSLPLRKATSIENIATMAGIEVRTVMLTLTQLERLNLAQQSRGGWTKKK